MMALWGGKWEKDFVRSFAINYELSASLPLLVNLVADDKLCKYVNFTSLLIGSVSGIKYRMNN